MSERDVGMAMGISVGIVILFTVLALAVCVFLVISQWHMFKKARKHGWAALVPFYNSYVPDAASPWKSGVQCPDLYQAGKGIWKEWRFCSWSYIPANHILSNSGFWQS